MRAIFVFAAITLLIAGLRTAEAKPPGSCEPWPQCKDGDDGSGGSGGSGGSSAFSDNCKTLDLWTVSGAWTVSRGECSAKNTDAEHTMTSVTDIDLSDALDATLSYKYRIENADPGEFMTIWVSDDGGVSFVDVKTYLGSESGTASLNLADHVILTNEIRLRASCQVSANNELCAWDNIKIEAVTDPPGEMQLTIDSPQARTYGAADFPLTYHVTLSQSGMADYSLNGGPLIPMTGDEGGAGTELTAVEDALGNGAYTFEVFATNEAGESTASESLVFAVDTLAPAVEFVDPTPANGSSQNNPDIPVRLATNAGSDHYAVVDFDSDLYLWLRMEDVQGDAVIDSSSYGNDGLAEGDAFQNPNGRFGAAFEFDGINHGGGIPTDRILVPDFQTNHPIFDSSFTAMAWARPDVNEKMVIVGTKSITNLPGWHLRTSGGNHRLRMGVNTGFTTETAAFAEARDPMAAGVWVHVVGVYDSTVPSIRLYLDGELIDTATDGVSSGGYGNDLELAVAVPEDPQKAWDGLVDEVLIFNRVLDGDEINAIYDSAAHQFQKTYSGLATGAHDFTGISINATGEQNRTDVRSVTID